MPTMPFCNTCLKMGRKSRLKRVYYRLVGRYSEIGWLCPSCTTFYLDHQALIDDENKIFGTDRTVEDLKKAIALDKKVLEIVEENDHRKRIKLQKLKKETHPEENFAE